MESYIPLIWALLIGTAVALYVILDGFDLGIGILFPFAKEEKEQDQMINSIAPFWDGNETWLVLGGGGLLSGTLLAAGVLAPRCRVYGVEPAAGNDGQRSLRQGSIVRIEVPKTIADGAQTQSLGRLTFERLPDQLHRHILVPGNKRPGLAAFLPYLGSRDRGRQGVGPRGVVKYVRIRPAVTQGLTGVQNAC